VLVLRRLYAAAGGDVQRPRVADLGDTSHAYQLPPADFRANFSDDWSGCSAFAEAEWWVV
jgi:hypothetical protein